MLSKTVRIYQQKYAYSLFTFQGGEDYDNYGIDWDQAAGEVEPDLVEVPETTTVLSEAQVEEIRGLIPENVTINNAIDIFTNILNRTLEYVNL